MSFRLKDSNEIDNMHQSEFKRIANMREENLRSSFGDASAFFGMDSMRSGGITSAPFNVAELLEEDPPEAGPEDATTLADDEQLMLFKFLALVLENAIKKYPNSV